MRRSLLEILDTGPIRKSLYIPVPEDLPPIADAFDDAGEELYIVGGAVRDALLGKKPKDYDLVTGAEPDRVIDIVSQDPSHRIDLTGKAFGVVRVHTTGGEEYEIATFRKDVGEGRRPDSVEFTTIENDVNRRDLTINALFYDMATGEAVDYVGGIADVENGIIRAVGEPSQRFREDKLRILRAVRFAARLGSNLDMATADAIKQDNDLSGVSPERTREEFAKAVASAQDGEHLLSMMEDLDLWPQVFPGLHVDPSVAASKNFDVQVALLLSDNDPGRVMKVLRSMKYTSDEVNVIRFLQRFPTIDSRSAPQVKKEFKRLRLDPQKLQEFANKSGVSTKMTQGFLRFVQQPPSVNPQDLMAQGLKGPQIGQAMNAAESKAFSSMTELRKYVSGKLREIKKRPGSPGQRAFYRAYNDATHQNPLNYRERYWGFQFGDNSDGYVLTEIKPQGGGMYISSMETRPENAQGHGMATSVMKKLITLSDTHGVELSLTPVPFGMKSMSASKLKSWYTRLGFENDPSRGFTFMHRMPQ